jgi:predicted DNA-binding transcriptional regulator AlpA
MSPAALPVRLQDAPDVLSIREVCAVAQISRATFDRMRRAGLGPQPTGYHRHRFLRSAVGLWLEHGPSLRRPRRVA